MFETYQHRCREKTSNNFHLEDIVYCGGRTVFEQSLKRSVAKIMTREALGSSFDSNLKKVQSPFSETQGTCESISSQGRRAPKDIVLQD